MSAPRSFHDAIARRKDELAADALKDRDSVECNKCGGTGLADVDGPPCIYCDGTGYWLGSI